MPHRVISNDADVADMAAFLTAAKKPLTVSWVQGRDRSLDQNALQFMWASEVAKQRFEQMEDVRADWKLRHGIPILRRDIPEFRESYDRTLKPLTYEQKVAFIRDTDFPVTSIMKVRQFTEYLDAIQMECLSQGLRLTDPSEDLAKYHDRYRSKS